LRPGHPGTHLPDGDPNRRAISRIEEAVLISMGGPAAEASFTGRRDHAAGRDRRDGNELAGYVHEREALGRYIDFMIARADVFFARRVHRERAEVLAAALLERRTLFYRGAREVYKDAGRRGDEAARGAAPRREGEEEGGQLLAARDPTGRRSTDQPGAVGSGHRP
jgi:hypothetical protein